MSVATETTEPATELDGLFADAADLWLPVDADGTLHLMWLATPHHDDLTHPGSWRALCTCERLDGPERATRGEAVADHADHFASLRPPATATA